MAHQFHVAHSKSVIGAGIIAGGPYFCARGSIYNLCSCVNVNNCFIAPADVHASIKATQNEAAQNRIDRSGKYEEQQGVAVFRQERYGDSDCRDGHR